MMLSTVTDSPMKPKSRLQSDSKINIDLVEEHEVGRSAEPTFLEDRNCAGISCRA